MLGNIIRYTYKIRSTYHTFTYMLQNINNRVNTLGCLKDSFKNKPILIVGNGPSLNKTPLEDFKELPAIGMNKINLIFKKTDWRPTIIICTNRYVVKQNLHFYSESNIPIYISWKNRNLLCKDNYNNISFFLEKPTRKFSCNILNGLGQSGTVTYACLQFAYFMGANPVILFGVDHKYKFEGAKNDIVTAKETDVNHFDKNYFSKGMKWGLPNLKMSENGYINARKAFEADGRTVYDATIGGKLNVFKKISLKEARQFTGTN